MKTSTYQYKVWAKKHKLPAQTLITLFHILISLMAVFSSIAFFELFNQLPFLFFTLPLGLMFTILYYYKVVKKQPKGTTLNHFLMIGLRFCLWLSISNSTLQVIDYQQSKNYGRFEKLASMEQKIQKLNDNPQNDVKISKKIKEELKKHLPLDIDYKTDWKILLFVFLGLVVFAVLSWITIAISCTLACNGMEAMATIVFILGLSGLITSEFFIVKKIIKLFKKLKGERPEDYV